jgi:hypothetical protein
MDADPPAEPPVCVPPLSGVCPICRVGPGDLPSRRFFEALKQRKPTAEIGAPSADDATPPARE